MFALLLLLACGGDTAPDEAKDDAPATEAPARKVTKAAWVGDWVMGDKILATDKKGEMKLMWEGDVVMQGPLSGKGLNRVAPLDGCGAKLKLSEVGGDITVKLNGPECPIDFAGTYINTVSP